MGFLLVQQLNNIQFHHRCYSCFCFSSTSCFVASVPELKNHTALFWGVMRRKESGRNCANIPFSLSKTGDRVKVECRCIPKHLKVCIHFVTTCRQKETVTQQKVENVTWHKKNEAIIEIRRKKAPREAKNGRDFHKCSLKVRVSLS